MKNLLILGCIAILFAGCSPSAPSGSESDAPRPDGVTVATSFYPLTHFAEQVGGEYSTVYQVAATSADPHSYEPTPQQIQQVYDADVLIFNGAGQDPWADRLHEELEANGVRVLIATELVDRMAYAHDDEHGQQEVEENHDAEHRDDHEDDHADEGHDDHEHGEWDPHVWLDPQRAEQIVQAIASTLVEIDPSHAAAFRSNADAYIAELRALDRDMRTGLSGCLLDTVVVSHDAYRYMAHRYGFHTLEIAGLSPGVEPSPARLAELTRIAEEKGIAHVFFETHVSPALSQTLAQEIGAQTLVLHSIEALTPHERSAGTTYIDLMGQNLANLRTALQCP